jgi:hypothetical protein
VLPETVELAQILLWHVGLLEKEASEVMVRVYGIPIQQVYEESLKLFEQPAVLNEKLHFQSRIT